MATILDNIQSYVGKYVQLGKDESLAIAVWVLHSWTFSPALPSPFTTPYLYIYSAERRSGKTRLLEVLETIIRNPIRAVDVTSAVLFRSIETLNPTLLLDEVDAIWSGAKNEELRGVLNAGYKRGGKVPRVEKGEPRFFNVFGPKALAGIDNAMLPDTVRDRCIPIHMHRQKAGESTPFYSFDVEDEADALMGQIEDWVSSKWPKLQELRPAPIDGIGDRAFEISISLLMLAAGFDKATEKAVRSALKRLLTVEEQLTPQAQLLADIRDLFDAEGTHTIPVSMILEKIGGNWSGKLLANRLRPYGVKPSIVRFHNQTTRGYYRRDFEDAWQRYLD